MDTNFVTLATVAALLPTWVVACGDDEEASAHGMGGDGDTGLSSTASPGGGGDGGSSDGGCPPPNAVCGGECIDLRRDVDHCGACDNACEARLGFVVECISFDQMEPVCTYECEAGTTLNTLTGMCE